MRARARKFPVRHGPSAIPRHHCCTFVFLDSSSYDDPQSIAIKAGYVRQHGLGGVMFWEQSQDSGGVLVDAIVKGLKK
jgi:hypothetical protein